ncbi:DNA polymerase III subunit chi [Pararhizobium mangrovi]|uniref:DNA polymerase III subunit chi n=1 Tax=Pararhizobium mangrovi TaxID=2590452 RepID=A0A506UDN2_9HYPH|nr:DNA polymerase III subunit chi [Pararhizobium mangrovi]TPW32050.1 DNA polymerase III subunit chi [Pararhizobium mangrovi]
MTEVLFYHLTESRLEDALPPLLEKSVERGWRVVVQTGSDERRDALDAHLWTYREASFLAHGTDRADYADLQPILLTSGEDTGNGATVRFLVDAAQPGEVASYERVVFMFDGHDQDQLEAARAHWRSLKDAGMQLTYWQQTPERRWERKA